MRCLTLAGALADRGARCAFLEHPAAAAALQVFAPPGVDRLGSAARSAAAMIDEAARLADLWEADGVVVDHYGCEAALESRLGGRPVAVLDDLADRPHACRLLMDPSVGRTAGDYAGLVPGEARVLAGPDYALVRPAFGDLRRGCLSRRRLKTPPRRLLVSLGLTDLDGITARVVDAVAPVMEGVQLDVVLGADAPSLRPLRDRARRQPGLAVHVDTPRMADLVASADLAIGAGGSSVWERACLGLPSILVVLADNQRPMAAQLQRAGAAILLEASAPGFDRELREAVQALRVDTEARSALSTASAGLCDGGGAGRVAEAVLGLLRNGEP